MRSGGICGIGVGEGAANGDGDGEAEGDVLGCAFCARKVTLMQQKTTTKKVRIIINCRHTNAGSFEEKGKRPRRERLFVIG